MSADLGAALRDLIEAFDSDDPKSWRERFEPALERAREALAARPVPPVTLCICGHPGAAHDCRHGACDCAEFVQAARPVEHPPLANELSKLGSSGYLTARPPEPAKYSTPPESPRSVDARPPTLPGHARRVAILESIATYARIAVNQIICMGGPELCQPCENRNRLAIALADLRAHTSEHSERPEWPYVSVRFDEDAGAWVSRLGEADNAQAIYSQALTEADAIRALWSAAWLRIKTATAKWEARERK